MLYPQYVASLILLITTVKIKGDCPQSSFERAELYICTGKCISQTVRSCVDSESFIGDVTSVSFINTKVPNFRRAIFNNMIHLKSIHAKTTGITRIYPDAFHNTRNLETVDLTFNFLEEIPYGVFNNNKFRKIELSWNNINFIEQEAFSNLPYLHTLRLTRNRLDTFDNNWLKGSPSMEYLDLSYNRITKLQFPFHNFPNLTVLDLSFNQILQIGGGLFKNIKLMDILDLTRNNLTALSSSIFPDKMVIKELRIALNKISFLSERLLNQITIETIMLNPNPWQCPCLDNVEEWASKNEMTILPPGRDYRIKVNSDFPACALRATNPDVCVYGYDEDFVSTQEIYFQEVNYADAVQEKPTSEAPNFDVLQIDMPFRNFSSL